MGTYTAVDAPATLDMATGVVEVNIRLTPTIPDRNGAGAYLTPDGRRVDLRQRVWSEDPDEPLIEGADRTLIGMRWSRTSPWSVAADGSTATCAVRAREF